MRHRDGPPALLRPQDRLRPDRLGHLAWLLPPVAAWTITAETGGDTVAGVNYPLLWVAATIAGCAFLGIHRARQSRVPSAADVLAAEAVCAMVLSLAVTGQSQLLRDLDIYIGAGRHFLDGSAVYTTAPIAAYPHDLGTLPFLYPPPLVPVLAVVAVLPAWLARIAWVGASAAAAIVALRRFRLPWGWIALLLAWTPLSQGLYVGNVAVPALLLLAFAPAAGSLLVGVALLKPQSGVLALWLVREARWRALVVGLVGIAAIVAATIPLTGLGMWRDWFAGLDAYAASQRLVPGLYGFGLPRYLPWPVPPVLGVGAILLALRSRRTLGLGRLAWASAVASPSLWAHGFLVAIPALFALDRTWLWFALALTSSVRGPGWVLALAVPPAAWAVSVRRSEPLRRDAVAGEGIAAPREALDDWPAPAGALPATAPTPAPGPNPEGGLTYAG